MVFRYLKGPYRKAEDKHFSRDYCDRTNGNGFILQEGQFRLDIRRKFFYNEAGKTLKVRLNDVLSNLI